MGCCQIKLVYAKQAPYPLSYLSRHTTAFDYRKEHEAKTETHIDLTWGSTVGGHTEGVQKLWKVLLSLSAGSPPPQNLMSQSIWAGVFPRMGTVSSADLAAKAFVPWGVGMRDALYAVPA